MTFTPPSRLSCSYSLESERLQNMVESLQDVLPTLVRRLRRLGTDTVKLEVKSAAGGLPKSTSETLSAFANGDGGVLHRQFADHLLKMNMCSPQAAGHAHLLKVMQIRREPEYIVMRLQKLQRNLIRRRVGRGCRRTIDQSGRQPSLFIIGGLRAVWLGKLRLHWRAASNHDI